MSAKFNFGGLDKPFEADWPVSIPVPQDGGTVELQTIMARFRLLSPAELEAVKETRDDDAFLKAFWIGFGKGEDEPFTEGTVNKMLGFQFIRQAFLTAYFAFASGSPVKN